MALFRLCAALGGEVTVLLFISTGELLAAIAAASAQRAPLSVVVEETELILSWVVLSAREVPTELAESSSLVRRRPVSSRGRESDLRAICRPGERSNDCV